MCKTIIKVLTGNLHCASSLMAQWGYQVSSIAKGMLKVYFMKYVFDINWLSPNSVYLVLIH